MSYTYFTLALICFLLAGVLELKSRKTVRKSRAGTGVYVEIGERKKERRTRVKEIEDVVKEERSKFDHLFKIPFKKKADENTREQILREAETLPDIPKVGEEDELTSYFRIEDKRPLTTSASERRKEQRAEVKPEDWIFIDPKKLEEEEENGRKTQEKKNQSEWTPPIFFDDS